jgi:AAA15 family ATPase/GTPase
MADTTIAVSAAAHDEELAKLEAEVMGQTQATTTEPPAPESATPSVDETTTNTPSASEETNATTEVPTPAPTGEPKEVPTTSEGNPQTSEELTPEEVTKLSHKAQKRYAEITKQNRELKDRLEKLSGSQTPRLPTTQTPPPSLPWQTDAVTPPPSQDGREVTQAEYEAEIESKAREVVRKEFEQREFLQNLHTDISECERKYPELNPMADNYDDGLATRIANWYKAQVQQNPNLRMKEFVDDVMSIKAKANAEARSQVTGKVIQQANNQALSPTTPSTNSKSVEDLLSGAKSMADLDSLERYL